ncbi:hypothetical protein M405DRAFT_337522 [Rhizopogon salebrosus TDB-379]|nr:hypothetical protein M405DRAFT_337522 [Rhizopogon salebrosus TDB-379]
MATTRSSTRRQLPTTVRHSREFQGPAQRGVNSSFIHHSVALLSLLFRPAGPHDLLLWPHGCALDGWLVLVITMECVHLWHRSIESSKNLLHRRAGRSLSGSSWCRVHQMIQRTCCYYTAIRLTLTSQTFLSTILWYGYDIIPCCLRSCHNNLETLRMLFAPLSASAGASGVHRESMTAQCIMMFFSHASDMHLKRQDDAPPECGAWS